MTTAIAVSNGATVSNETAGPAETRVFGIRHHGPGSARSLALALARFRPDAILIEGPSDADPLVGYLAAEGMSPPVALLAYQPDQPAKAAFWPFATFSPEWVALRYATENGVSVGFCDLPAAVALAVEDEPGDRTDPLGILASAAGYDDAERWWDAIVESSSDADIFAAVNEAMGALREHAEHLDGGHADQESDSVVPVEGSGTAEDELDELDAASARITVDAHTLRREAHMRQVMRKALKDGATRLAVVCGAWHAPALEGKLGPAVADARILKGLPKVKATLTWVPWTHSRLASSSGYGAGVTSPGWYHHLFTETEQPIARWLTKVAGTLRAHDLPVSSAHIIESVRLADTLATLRGRPLAGLSEVTEATRAVLCDGDETMLRLVSTELVVGEAMGTVPDGTPTVPLEADLRAQIKTLRLKQQALEKTLDLDLRTEGGLARSQLLHRLRLLGIGWGKLTEGQVRNTGTFREPWTLRWLPELAISIVEASRWGTTLRSAAEAKVLDTAADPDATVGKVASVLEEALLADLGGATDGLIARLESVAALDHDVTHLLSALPGLLRIMRYGDVRGTDSAALTRVADSLLVRACAGLPGAVTGLDTDAANALRVQIDAVHLALAARDNEWATGTWLSTLETLADRDDVNGGIVGRAVRLLCDAERIDSEESGRRLSAALSVGRTAPDKASWIDGFLGGRGLLLVHDRNMLALIDNWLCGLDEAQFVATLPLLRRTFGAFESGERQAIGQAVRHGAPSGPAAGGADYDPARGLLAMRAAAEILGVAG
ncbi:DUF5682 family protein [Nocardia seriolae]|uniref:Uncharacterized protein n=1 Tax=Nocardia seriolae TaxID=37332 RepID=A0ABC8APU2_9NOCA|nr:DUF5682 family protein [Nocardia seriolae]APA96115.1 hypothetical protein NS506_02048 [Nocardia seriolae]WKY53781.1 DUF5682 family protein [Nocardia seriolae]WNJ60520.1 DUF5682 family protein [Nocardia seriolae]BAW09511.1 conserved hypothetical protein [Nocardia seriolae]BEK85608.1 DUF5682 family protein [Nocardia seriolae]